MIDFETRLKSLKARRQGSPEMTFSESAYDTASLTESSHLIKAESFETIKESNGVKYAIGAMAAVDKKSTEISIREGNRVADSLITSLHTLNESVMKRLQGSVALDIHIKGHSDVDMLIIVADTITIERPIIGSNNYLPKTDPRDVINIIKDVRKKSEILLPINFPNAKVNPDGDKSIAISGGSLLRKVDIVPAIWYDCRQYQQTNQEHDRGINIYHKTNHEFLLNYPFTHIKRVNDRDTAYSGNLKCAIRLMKNMIADMPDYKSKITKRLSSYDLAAIGYHMGDSLQLANYMRLGLVENIRAFLMLLLNSKVYRESLWVPDETRKIFDDEAKIEALEILASEFTDLAKSIFKELKPYNASYDPAVITNKAVFNL